MQSSEDARAIELQALLACPACAGALTPRQDDTFRCLACSTGFAVSDGIPSLRAPADQRTERVRAFYGEAPFPGYRPRDTLHALRTRAAASPLARMLDEAIPEDARVLDLGCGTGQMTLFLARDQRLLVGADLTRASLALARQAVRSFGVQGTLFVETDLRHPGLRPAAFDVVLCLGVLHHTPDPRAAFAAVARLVRPGGVLVVGLYNAIARLPHRLRRLVARLSGMRLLLADPVLRDRRCEPERRRAWLNDQYLHPEEHRHTLGEVQGWFRANHIEYLRSYPPALIGADPMAETPLFTPIEDDWWFERMTCQLGWAMTLGAEGGLFVTVGRRALTD
jgi:2-polyprenyl-3-methyl-5-hydroxy-6-metoxy-1,4-benzoquinol methylase